MIGRTVLATVLVMAMLVGPGAAAVAPSPLEPARADVEAGDAAVPAATFSAFHLQDIVGAVNLPELSYCDANQNAPCTFTCVPGTLVWVEGYGTASSYSIEARCNTTVVASCSGPPDCSGQGLHDGTHTNGTCEVKAEEGAAHGRCGVWVPDAVAALNLGSALALDLPNVAV